MEIKIKKQTTIEEVFNIEMPYYCKSSCFAYKVINDKECIDVQFDGFSGISIKLSNFITEHIMSCDPITKQEFNEIYNEVLTKINQSL